MSRQTWTIEKDVADTWTADGTIYRPNENLSVDTTTTKIKTMLADGSVAFVTPENKTTDQALIFQWLEILESDTFRAKIEAYVTNQDYLRITTHLNEQFTGYFISKKRLWIKGVDDAYDIEAIFERNT